MLKLCQHIMNECASHEVWFRCFESELLLFAPETTMNNTFVLFKVVSEGEIRRIGLDIECRLPDSMVGPELPFASGVHLQLGDCPAFLRPECPLEKDFPACHLVTIPIPTVRTRLAGKSHLRIRTRYCEMSGRMLGSSSVVICG